MWYVLCVMRYVLCVMRYVLCVSIPTQTPRFTSDRALICLNTCEFRNALRLNDEIRRGQNVRLSSLVPLGFALGILLRYECPKASLGAGEAKTAEFQPPPPERGRCRDSGGGGAMSGRTSLSIDSEQHRERHILTPRRRIPPRRRCRGCGRWGGGTLGSCTFPPRGL